MLVYYCFCFSSSAVLHQHGPHMGRARFRAGLTQPGAFLTQAITHAAVYEIVSFGLCLLKTVKGSAKKANLATFFNPLW